MAFIGQNLCDNERLPPEQHHVGVNLDRGNRQVPEDARRDQTTTMTAMTMASESRVLRGLAISNTR